MWVEKTNKTFAYRIYRHFTQQCIGTHISQFSGGLSPSAVVPLLLYILSKCSFVKFFGWFIAHCSLTNVRRMCPLVLSLSFTVYILGQQALITFLPLCWTGLNWFIGPLSRASDMYCLLYFSPRTERKESNVPKLKTIQEHTLLIYIFSLSLQSM